MKADIVCEGGGVKGIALLGAIYYLEEKGYTFQNFAGTSAGAIVSSLLAVGYTGKELKELLLNIKFTDFYEKNKFGIDGERKFYYGGKNPEDAILMSRMV